MENDYNSTTIPRRMNGTNLIRTWKIEQKINVIFVINFIILFSVPTLLTLIYFMIAFFNNNNYFTAKSMQKHMHNFNNISFYLYIYTFTLVFISLIFNFIIIRIINKNEYPFEYKRTVKMMRALLIVNIITVFYSSILIFMHRKKPDI